MNYGTVRRIAKGVADGWNIIVVPHRCSMILGNVIVYPVAEYREFVIERVIHANNLFSNHGGYIVTANEVAIGGCRCREDAAVVPTCGQQCLCVGIQQR